MKTLFLKFINFYQRYLSIFSFGSCRYYPTCSAYAKMQFEHNTFLRGFVASFLRILRCNQLFKGGIDYPIVSKKFKRLSLIYVQKNHMIEVKFWFVPYKKGNFYIIKQINFSQPIK